MHAGVLIVDDEKAVAQLIGAILSQEGYLTTLAHSRREAEELLQRHDYDIVFIDIMLDKEKSGMALLQTISGVKPGAKVIMMTGYPDVATASEAVRCGAFDYLCKPFDTQQIISITRHAAENRILLLERERYRANLEAINRSIEDALVMVDSHLTIQYLNEAAYACGYSPENLGQPIDRLHAGCQGSCRMTLLETIRTSKRQELKRIECRNRNRTRIVTVVTSPILGTDGRLEGAVAVIRDETVLHGLERTLQQRSRFQRLLGRTTAMQHLYSQIEALADVSSTVLICGESGTGKELVAEALHECGSRRGKPFVKINCAALPENLLESELFGHLRGSFSGAVKDKVGHFQKAHRGTILLDEIGDISPALQIRLLRVLQEREIERVGDTTPIKIDVRIITATHQNLQEKVRRGEFRQDLFYRLNVVRLTIPPLRDRLEDIPLLVSHFLSSFSTKFNRAFSDVSEDVMATLMAHSWPGNVRELEHLIEHACILSKTSVITSASLPVEFYEHPVKLLRSTEPTTTPASGMTVAEAIAQAGGNRTKAARLLGISRRTLYRRLDEKQ